MWGNNVFSHVCQFTGRSYVMITDDALNLMSNHQISAPVVLPIPNDILYLALRDTLDLHTHGTAGRFADFHCSDYISQKT